MRVVICGAGAVGACLAYFLARRGATPIVVERAGVACAASGKSGGFLALDWCDRTPLERLARRSFALHASLAEELAEDWGYRRMTTYAGHGGEGVRGAAGRHRLAWVADGIALTDRLGSTDTTAQVHPGRFTAAMMSAAEAHGAELRNVSATRIVRGRDGGVQAVETGDGTISADAVVIAMGPWSRSAAQW
ncbi:MAG TPA: FAD-dependent oxidoreductase, partial [Beijerinckiaceae bacterium]|nr:FAD-dependent oxidoreductase [Beijerinckiaceae bacterium]